MERRVEILFHFIFALAMGIKTSFYWFAELERVGEIEYGSKENMKFPGCYFRKNKNNENRK